ncbi:MAG: mechanosensitive ion channel domain-containing protein [Bacteroidia bacterium]|jgi:MscS family membrane protein
MTFLGNTLEDYCWFAGILLVGLIFQRLLSKLLTLFVFKFLQKYTTGVGYERLLALLKRPMGVFVILIFIYLAFNRLDFPEEWHCGPIEKFGLRMVFYRTFQVMIVGSLTWILLRVVDFFGVVFLHRASLTETKTDDQLVPFIKETVKVVICIFSVFFILGAVFELNVASLVAGLGIGGLAIALAAKESLENLLGSFTIFLDKPFVIGDQIKVGSVEGKVENIGFRSTRIRTAEKSFVTVPNKKLIDNELDNFSLRTQKRVTFTLGLVYETKSDQLKNIVAEIFNAIENHEFVTKGETRVRMYGFDINSVNIMVLYFIDSIEYDIYLNVREEINYRIIEIVEKNGSRFAHQVTPVLATDGQK